MALYYYLKDPAKTEDSSQVKRGFLGGIDQIFTPQGLRPISIFFLSFGLGLLSWLAWPFLEWQVIYSPRFTETEIIKPLPFSKEEVRGENIAEYKMGETSNYRWFPQASPSSESTGKGYTLSIPKLKIKEAQVVIGGEDLSQSLIHYGRAALPGRNGTTIIFGHSVLPQFFNPQNYKTIFSTLHTLEGGDIILINFDGIEYRYEIFGSEVVEAEDLSFLEQRKNNSYLYLITCNPPGTYWKRLIVKAKLQDL